MAPSLWFLPPVCLDLRPIAIHFNAARAARAASWYGFSLLVSFAPDVQWGIFEHVEMEQELSDLAGRKVDLISRRAMEQSQNPIRRKAILDSATPLYVAR